MDSGRAEKRRGIERLFEASGRVEWRFDRTLVARFLGVPQARAVVAKYIQGSVGKIAWHSFVALTIVLLGVLGFLSVLPRPVCAVCGTLSLVHMLLVPLACWADTAILFGYVVRGTYFWGTLLAGLLGTLCISACLGFDGRMGLVPWNLAGTLWMLSLAAFPSPVRASRYLHYSFPFVQSSLCIALAVLIYLDRVLDYVDVVVNLGLLGGLASSPITFSFSQLGVSSLIAYVLLVMTQVSALTRLEGELGVRLFKVSLPVYGVDDQDNKDLFDSVRQLV